MLKVEDMVVGYRSPVAGPFNFEYEDGHCVMLRGRNGSGKTTLLKTLAGLLEPLSGSFESSGTVVMVPTRIPKVKGFTVKEFLQTSMWLLPRSAVRRSFPRLPACHPDRHVGHPVVCSVAGPSSLSGGEKLTGLFSGRSLRAGEEAALDRVISLLGLETLADNDLSRISDGEFQKACIATALTRHANVILLDEPTAFLDVENRIMVLSTLHDLAHSTGTTILFSTHDIHDGAACSDDTLML